MPSTLAALARRGPLAPGREVRIPIGPARGVRLEVNPGTTVHVYLGTAELELWRWLRRLAVPGVVAYDVGSSEGYYALLLARLTGSPVVAIEFQAEHLARLARNLERNPELAGRIEVRQAYVTGAVDPAHGATTIDALIADEGAPAPGLLKVDVEGAELDVLRGAARTLAEHRPHVVLETHSAALERACGELLVEAGYRPVVVHQRRVLREGRPNAENRWLVAPGG